MVLFLYLPRLFIIVKNVKMKNDICVFSYFWFIDFWFFDFFLWLRLKSVILVLTMEDRNLQKSRNINVIKRFVSMGYRIEMWFAINFLSLFLENSRKSTNFALAILKRQIVLALPSARLRIRRLYATHMLSICKTYIFAENIMSYIWLTYEE